MDSLLVFRSYLDRDLECKVGDSVLALLQSDVTSECLADDLAARETYANSLVLDFLEVLLDLELQEGFKQHLLALLTNAYSCIDDLGFEDVSGFIVRFGLLLQWGAI